MFVKQRGSARCRDAPLLLGQAARASRRHSERRLRKTPRGRRWPRVPPLALGVSVVTAEWEVHDIRPSDEARRP